MLRPLERRASHNKASGDTNAPFLMFWKGAFYFMRRFDSDPRIVSFRSAHVCRSDPPILSFRAILPEPEGRSPEPSRGGGTCCQPTPPRLGVPMDCPEWSRRLSRILRDLGFHNSIPLGTWNRHLRPLLVHTSLNRQPSLPQQMPSLPVSPILLPHTFRREVDRQIRPPDYLIRDDVPLINRDQQDRKKSTDPGSYFFRCGPITFKL